MTMITLADAERYVHAGIQYREGEYDCASFVVQVQRELFGRNVALPAAAERSAGRLGQRKDIERLSPQLATPVDEPQTGDAVLFWSTEGNGQRWHVGTVFLDGGDAWVLHIADEVQGVRLQRIALLKAEGMRLDSFHRWQTHSLAIAPRPLQQPIEVRQVAAGRTLAETLTAEGVTGTGWVVMVGGREVAPKHWHRVRVKAGVVVEARAVARKQILQLVAILVLTYFTFGIGAYGGLVGAAFGGGVAGFAAAAAVFVGGSILINKFLGPKLGSMGDMGGTQVPATYSLSGGQNRARQWQPLSLVLGETKAIPDLASQPYTWIESDDQYLSTIYHAGINAGSVTLIKNGDTDLSTYQDITVRQYGFPTGNSDVPPALGTSVDTAPGGLLDAETAPGAWRTATSSVGSARLEVDIQGTLSALNDRGKAITATATVETQMRPVGSSDWLAFGDGAYTFTNLGQKSFRRTIGVDVAEGQYEVRIRKMNADPTTSLEQQALEWTALKSYQPDRADYGGQPRVDIKAKATGQLNGAMSELSWIVTAAEMPIWNGTAWVTATAPGAAGLSNPGAQILRLLRGIYRSSDGKLIAGAGLPDRRIDIDSLKAFMVRCAAMDFRFDAVIQDSMSLDELLRAIAYTGLGSLTDHSGKIGVVYAAEAQPTEGVINMVAMKARSFEISYTLARTADEYSLEFFDRDSSWTWQAVRVQAPGTTTPQETSSENVRGVTRRDHAALLARFSMGQSLYGRREVSWEMDLEYIRFRRGSIVALSHDLTQWGYGGALRAVATSSGSFTLTLDEPVPTDLPSVRNIGINVPGEQMMRVFPVASVSPDGYVLTINQAWPTGAILPGEAATAPHDFRWVYDFKESPGYRVRILNIEPADGMNGARITAAPDSPELWNYIINGEYIPPPNNSLLTREIPVVSNLAVRRVRERVGDAWEHRLEATWNVRGRYASAVVRSGVIGEQLTIVEGGSAVIGTSHTWRIPSEQTWNVSVTPYDELGRPGVSDSVIYSDPSVIVGAVQNLSVTAEETGMWARWTAPLTDWNSTRLRLGATWESGLPLFDGRTDSHNLGFLPADEHVLWAVNVNSADDESPPVAFSFEVLAPLQPIVTASPEINEARLTWTPCRTTQPLRGYEVKIGDIYADAVLVGFTDGLGIVHTPPNSGTHLYWVTAFDRAENASPPGYVTVVTLPGITEGIAELQEGLDDAFEAIGANAADISTINAQIADITGSPDWAVGDTYAENAIVKHEGGLWRSKADGNVGNEPELGSTWWEKIGDYDSLGEAVAAHAIQLSDHETRIVETEDGLQAESERIDLLAASITSNGAEGIIADPELAQGTASWTPSTGLTAFAAGDAGVPAASPAAFLVRSDVQTSGGRHNYRKLRGAITPEGEVVRVTPGEVIDVTVWAYVEGTVSSATSLCVLHGPTEAPNTVVTLGAVATSGWQQLRGSFTVPPGSAFTRISMRRATTGAEGYAWYAGMQAARRGAGTTAINAAVIESANASASLVQAEATARQAVVASITSASSNNLITNPTFDSAGWRYAPDPGFSTVDYFARGDAGVPAGAPSARVMRVVKESATGTAAQRNLRFGTTAATLVEGRPGETVDFSFSVWAPSGTLVDQIAVILNPVDASNAVISAARAVQRYNVALGGWQTLAGVMTMPAGGVAFGGVLVIGAAAPAGQAMWVSEPDVRKRSASSLNLGASVQATSTALATLDGKVAASYTLTVTAGNKVAGFRVGTDGATSDFVVLADKFAWGYESLGQIKYGLVLGLIDGIASFGFSGNMYLDGVLQARMIGADQIRAVHIRTDEIEARHVKAGAITADKIAVGVSGNLLRNTSFITTAGWAPYDGIGGQQMGKNVAGLDWQPAGEDTLTIFQPGPGNTASAGAWFAEVAVEAGKRYGFSCYTTAHRCFTDVVINFFDDAYNYLGGSASSQAQTGGGRNLGAWTRQYTFATAPAGAVRARAELRKTHTQAGQVNSFAAFYRPMLEEASQYQTIPSPYQAAGIGTVITPEGVSTPSLSAFSPNLGLVVYGRMVSADGMMTVDMDNKSIHMLRNGRRVQINTNGFYFGADSGVGNRLNYDINSGALTLNGKFTADAIDVVDTLNIAGQGATTLALVRSGSSNYYGGDAPDNWITMLSLSVVLKSGGNGVVAFISHQEVPTTGAAILPQFRLVNQSTNVEIKRWMGQKLYEDDLSGVRDTAKTLVDFSPIIGTNTYLLQTLHRQQWVTHMDQRLTILASHR